MRAYLVLILLVLGVIVGAALVHFRLFPYPQLRAAVATIEDLVKNREAYFGQVPVNQMVPAVYDGDGVTVHDPARVAPGNTLLSGVHDNGIALWLMSPKGETIREWRPPTSEILSEADYVEGMEMPFNDFFVVLHGAALMPDGGTIFTIANYALVRMTPCGEVDWVVPTMAHHSVFASHDETYWAATRFYHDERDPEHPQYSTPFWEDAIIQVDAAGKVLQTISMLDVIETNQLWGKLYAGQRPEPETNDDFTHLNDVEVLSPELAGDFPDFEAGDSMVSLRNPNLVIVFDPATLEAKWTQTGPWIRQHDPDFTSDGRIAVFDNRNDGRNGRLFGGSRVVMIEPTAPSGGEWQVVYENSDATPFFSAKRGLLDLLENGNILITESESGRVFEIDESGEIAWEYISRFDGDRTAAINHAERYPDDFTEDAYSACN